MLPADLALSLYVVTAADVVPGRGHVELARAAAAGGADAVQLRAPGLGGDDLRRLARAFVAALAPFDVLSIVNDDLAVAADAGAGGAHLGQADLAARGLDVAEARRRMPGRVLGISADTPEQARAAAAGGADYLGVTVWGTGTKADARAVGLAGLREIVAAVDLPVVAIGGIDAERVPAALRAGAAGVAVVSAVAGSPDPVAATRRLRRVVDGAR